MRVQNCVVSEKGNDPDMRLWPSLLFFGLPGVGVCIATYWIVPIAVQLDVPLILAWTAAVWLPVILLLLWVLFRGSNPVHSNATENGFRLRKMTKTHWAAVAFANDRIL